MHVALALWLLAACLTSKKDDTLCHTGAHRTPSMYSMRNKVDTWGF